MQDVIVLGTGNIAEHLCRAFSASKSVQLKQVYGRNTSALKKFDSFTETCNNAKAIKEADIYLLAVSDTAITSVSELILHKTGVVAHVSGAISMNAIASENRGVFYPLQTFTKGKILDFKSIPICIEADNKVALEQLKSLANAVSDHVHEISSDKRKKLHLAAVFANNFTNHLYSISEEICADASVPFSLLHPLIMETAEKIKSVSPKDAQTGPARRGDQKSIQNHLELLKTKKQAELYTIFSEAIIKTYEEKL